MAPRVLRIATRSSPLALWQAHHIAGLLRQRDPSQIVEILELTTLGDDRAEVPISTLGGKGVFVKEVQRAVMDGLADVAVHSAKDLPSETPEGLLLAGVPERGDPRDVLVGHSLVALPPGAVVATGSARRRVQLQAARPDLVFEELRGNIGTRLGKAHRFGAIIMAKAALDRLSYDRSDVDVLDIELMTPQVGQGTLAAECRSEDAHVHALLQAIEHAESRRVLDAERAFLRELGGDCDLPAGAHAESLHDGQLTISGVLADADGSNLVRSRHDGDAGETLGRSLAIELRGRR